MCKQKYHCKGCFYVMLCAMVPGPDCPRYINDNRSEPTSKEGEP